MEIEHEKYIWKINDKILQRMKNAKNGQRFDSEQFKIDVLDWELLFYPNGLDADDLGSFSSYLKLVSLPAKWKHVIICFNIKCNETRASRTFVKEFNGELDSWGNSRIMSFSEIQPLNQLSFTISVRINEIKLKHCYQLFYQRKLSISQCTNIQWKIDNELLSKMKLCKDGEFFSSPMFNEAVVLDISTNYGGWVKIRSLLCNLPTDLSVINLTWKIDIKGSIVTSLGNRNFVVSSESTYDFDENNYDHPWGDRKLSFQNFQMLQDVIISMEIINNTEYTPNETVPEIAPPQRCKDAQINSISLYQNSCNKVSHFDQKSKDIVFGYIRNIQKIFTQHRNNMVIPFVIYRLCLLYIDDHFMSDQGTFVWNIMGFELSKFVDAENGQAMHSHVFNIIKLPWRLTIHPNGKKADSVGNVRVFLNLISFPAEWIQLTVRWTVMILETGYSWTSIADFKAEKNAVWLTTNQQLEEIQRLNSEKLTIYIKIHVLSIRTKDPKIYFKNKEVSKLKSKYQYAWKLNGCMLDLMARSSADKYFESPAFGGMWLLSMNPNCVFDEDEAESDGWWMYLQLVSMHHSVVRLFGKLRLEVIAMGDCIVVREKAFDMSYANCAMSCDMYCSFNRFKELVAKYNAITIVAIIDIHSVEWYNDHTCNTLDRIMEQPKELVTENEEKLKRLHKKIGELQTRMLSGLNNVNDHNGNMMDGQDSELVAQWLKETVKLPQYYDILLQNGFDDMEFVKDITKEDLLGIGIDKLGHQKRILKCVAKL